MAIKERGKDKVFDVTCNILATLIMILVIFPLINVLSSSISDAAYVSTGKVLLLPKGVNFDGYKRLFQEKNLIIGYGNTIYYTVFGTMLNLLLTLTAGYALSKKTLPGRGIIMVYILITMYFSGGLIPTFLVVRGLKLLDTRLILILIGAVSIYNLIVCRTFFQSIPGDLEDAAVIDGCSTTRLFVSIVLPISKALIGVMVLYYGVGHWNSYFSALIYIKDDGKKPLQLFLRRILILESMLAQEDGYDDEQARESARLKELIKYSSIVVSSLPVLITYPFLQKYFDKGILIGSLKG